MSSAFMSSWLLRASVNAGPPARLSASCSSLLEMARLLLAAHTRTHTHTPRQCSPSVYTTPASKQKH
jgi:hypothetical protein